MTLQQLRYVIMVAETGTITEAAGKLYISQPSLTNAIHELEKEMNLVIFNRTNRGISVTRRARSFSVMQGRYWSRHRSWRINTRERAGGKKQFCVSTQHYSFAVNAFVDLIKEVRTGRI